MKKLLLLIVIPTLLLSCASNKNIPYFRDIPLNAHLMSDTTLLPPDVHIVIGDALSITVATIDPTASLPFNLPIASYVAPGSEQLYSTPNFQPYIVDNSGMITFPVIGKIHVAGLNKDEVVHLLKQKLLPYLKNPVVVLQIMNFKVTVLGEVNHPGTYTIPNNQVTILQALGYAGDMTVFGKRSNVLLVRDYDGKKEYVRINFNKSALLNSPYYYLHQNDVLYVEPNSTKIINADNQNTSLYISVISTLVTTIAVLVSLFRK
ncbi:polysaccharide biosynthesis/export family protein [Microbacter margulisiae]|uniref:Polysaccharide export outer membrane protein n=1 Tax=Microbacter margulisiae TaxID=1350067 RepID=A0A7W5DSQ3_9PORP|nr:polysaccharide biosynthesis/export family protein [Microbacter margulisiae]MBB3187543.1 polysaccharide export outer membrane protein [Microbacter margulisiae]